MGVKGLWTLFAPYCEKKSLFEIQGQRVAIDLSGWVCDSQNVADQHQQPRLYLRNLFFRTSYLLVENITPIFVLEGEAPTLKGSTMANRNKQQYKAFASQKSSKNTLKKPDRRRKRFSNVLSHCEKLLKTMGLDCIQGIGEAEAMCAHLNSIKAVDAVISQDSDCFVYGANCVYRNFSVSNSGTNASNSGTVDVYNLEKIQKTLNFDREKMVALALLCGCDYNENGIDGIGCANALNYLTQYSDGSILDRFTSWVTEPAIYDNIIRKLDDPTHCANCGHAGNGRSHSRFGCSTCNTKIGCDQSYRDTYQLLKAEINLRKKVIHSSKNFPDSEIINEYLTEKETTPKNFRPRWRKPNMIHFVKLMTQSLAWTEYYCVEKFLPLLTRWQLLHKSNISGKENISLFENDSDEPAWLVPDFIKKKRTPKGIPSYEVIWKDTDDYFDGLIPDDQLKENDDQSPWTTIERQDLMEKAYPEIVQKFLDSKKKKTKNKKEKPAKNNAKKIINRDAGIHDLEQLDVSMKNMNITPKKNSRRKRTVPCNEVSYKIKSKKYKRKPCNEILHNASQKKIDVYLKKVNDHARSIKTAEKENSHNGSIKMDNTAILIDAFNNLDSDDSFSDEDISNIIEDIVERCNNTGMQNFLKNENIFNNPAISPNKVNSTKKINSFSKVDTNFCSTPIYQCKKRISNFFNCMNEDEDIFEKTLDLKNAVENHDSKKYSSEEYEALSSDDEKTILKPACRKSSLTYTPLLERIRKLKEC